MPQPKHVPDEQVVDMIRNGLTITEIMRKMSKSGAFGSTQLYRVKTLAKENGLTIFKANGSRKTKEESEGEEKLYEYIRASGHARRSLKVRDGIVLVGSDAHYWPGIVSTAHRAFVKFCRELKPRAVIKNGDVIDASTTSRWPRIGWQYRPTMLEELKAAQERMTEIEDAAGTKELYWPAGNHDSRFSSFLAANAPQYEGVKGTDIKDHFPLWRLCWSMHVNEDVVIKHRMRNGVHATWNNTLHSGRTMVTGHLHSLQVRPFSDYDGTRFGVDCGTLAQPHGEQFHDYCEDNPTNWRSGFVVLTFWRGKLLWPDVAHVIDEERGLIQFRGQVMEV